MRTLTPLLDALVGPDTIDAKVPKEHNYDSQSFGDIISQREMDKANSIRQTRDRDGQRSGLAQNKAIQSQKDNLVYSQTGHIDQYKLAQLREQWSLPRFRKCP